MADMNDFQDIETRLRRYPPAGPSADVRDAVLEQAPHVRPALRRSGLRRLAAAVVLVVALNLGTEWWISSRTRVGAAGPTQEAAPSNAALLEAINGFATHWGHLAVHWNGYEPRSASWWRERERLVKEFTQ